MSRISEKNREVVKRQIYEALTNEYQSVLRISESVGRSWRLVSVLLKEMASEPGKWANLQNECLADRVCWRKEIKAK